MEIDEMDSTDNDVPSTDPTLEEGMDMHEVNLEWEDTENSPILFLPATP